MADWNGLTTVPSYADNPMDQGGGSTDITAVQITSGDGNPYVRWDVKLTSNKNEIDQAEDSIEAAFPLVAFNPSGALIGLQTETNASPSPGSATKDCAPGSGSTSTTACNGFFTLDTDTGTTTVTAGHVTTTTMTCSPASRPIGQTSTCTITVHDTGVDTNNNAVTATHPTGTVNFFVSGGTGTFSPVACGLSPAVAAADRTCTVQYTPATTGTGTHLLEASYAGDTSPIQFASSSGTFSLSVNSPPSATTPSFSPASPTTNDTLTASTTTSDPDGNNVSVAWTWKVTRRINTCTIKTDSSAAAPGGARSVTLDLGANYVPSSCTGSLISPLNPSRGDVVTVEATPNDGFVNGTLQSNSVTIANTAPTATVSLSDHSPKTNDTLTATATKSDLDGDSVALTYVWKVNGTVKRTFTSSSALTDSFDLSQAGNGNKGDTVSVEVTPNDGTTNWAGVSDSATVADSAPTATVLLNNHSPKTNDTLTATATKSDLDGDSVTLTYVWKVNGVVKKTTSGSSSLTDTFDLSQSGNGSKGDTIRVEVTPNDGTANGSTVSDSATVANSAPAVTLSAANSLSVNEGSTQTYSYSISDPDGDTIASIATSCGANGTKVGSDAFTNTGGSFQCSFGDGPNSSTVSAQANDGAAAGNTDTQVVSILNLAPTATLANSGPVSEGSSAMISFSGQSDASSADTSAGFRYEYRCDGSAFPGPANYGTASSSASASCSFDDNGSYTVRARIIDKDSGATSYTTTVTVNNVAPTATLANNGPIDEGSSATISFSGQSDPSNTDTSAGFHYAYSCSNGDLSSATYAGSSASATAGCSYSDGPSTHTVRARIIDKDGGYREYPMFVTVRTVAPG